MRKNSLKATIRAKMTICRFAQINGINKGDLSNYLNGKKNRLGKVSKKKIKQALIESGFIPKPAPIEYVKCETCGYKHRKKVNEL
jgi:hypothetical protein